MFSDRLKVRKPLMIVGCLGTITTTIVFALLATRPHTGYHTFAIVFLPFAAMMRGRWSPRRAREDAEAHEEAVARELAKLQAAT